jgi:hypothetical protein
VIDLGPVIVAVVCVLYVLYAARNSSEQASSDKSENLVFPLVPSFRISLKAASVLFGGGALLSLLDRAPGWTTALFGVAASISTAVPNVIALTPQGVECRYALGMLTKRIGWSDLESASEIPGEGTIVFHGKNGSSISHSSYHVDHEGLLVELSNRNIAINGQGDF